MDTQTIVLLLPLIILELVLKIICLRDWLHRGDPVGKQPHLLSLDPHGFYGEIGSTWKTTGWMGSSQPVSANVQNVQVHPVTDSPWIEYLRKSM